MPDDQRCLPARVGDSIVIPIDHAAVIAAELRERAPRPVGVAARRRAAAVVVLAQLVEDAAKDLAFRNHGAMKGVVARSGAPARLHSNPEVRWSGEEMTVDEAAKIAGVSLARMRAMAAGGYLRARKTRTRRRGDRAVRTRWVLCASDVREYIAQRP